MTIQIKNQEAVKQLSNPLLGDGEIRLPFPAPVFWVMNGNAQLKQQGGASYFGGWASGAEELVPIAEELGKTIPPTFKQIEFVARDGTSVNVYTTRYVTIVPIAKRLSSVDKATNVRYPGYRKGASPHLQIVAYLSYDSKEGKEQVLLPWGPIVLSAKGYQAGHVLDAFAQWDRESGKVRRQHAPGLPSNFFFCRMGTFGDKPNIVKVGKNDTSPITPIELYVPKAGLAEAELQYLFAGDDLIAEAIQLRDQAKEWMNAWKKPVEPKPSETDENGDISFEEPGIEEIP